MAIETGRILKSNNNNLAKQKRLFRRSLNNNKNQTP